MARLSRAIFYFDWKVSFMSNGSISNSPQTVIPVELRTEFLEWAKDGGYDESYFNRWDSKSRDLEETFLLERLETGSNFDQF
jgi:hypothetical protein